MTNNRIDLALYVIDMKLADTIKNNKAKTYAELEEKINLLKQEKERIYNHDDKIIDKVLNEYLPQVKWGV